ncbi:MAG: ATP-binding protein, partial [bacterium]
ILERNIAAGAFIDARHSDALVGALVNELLAESLAGRPAERTLELFGPPRRAVVVITRPLGVTGIPCAVAIIEDVTERRRLEAVRTDFVANISHELKTPITALRGCVETLSDPVHRNADGADRFIAMMRRQVERLTAIVEDLLSLSRIEHDAEHKRIPLESGVVCEVLRRAAQAFAEAGGAKAISVEVECPGDLIAPLNAALLEQAVGNLVDNAIKYSGEHTRVVVSARLNGNDIEIMVADQGFGIEKKHLSRIFERFYRVDQARSRALGGTGLGLAIVKHIVLAHGGVVSVDSTPGQGSTFTIRIPRQ